MANLIQGYDVSSIQGKIDYTTLGSEIQFIIARCGNGNDPIDSMYNTNRTNAKNAGLKFAAYNVIFPLPTNGIPSRSPQAQAQMHFQAAAGELACVDAEWPLQQDWAKWNCSAAQITDWIEVYMEEYALLSGKWPIFYSFPYWIQALGEPMSFSPYKLWIASYQQVPVIPAPWQTSGWTIWQHDDNGKLPNGVLVDRDVMRDFSIWD